MSDDRRYAIAIRNRMEDRTALRKELFISVLKKVYTVSIACELASVSRSQAYKWKNEDPAFAEQWEDAQLYSEDALESAALLKVAETLTDKRRKLEMPVERMTEFLLSGMKPEKYRKAVSSGIEQVSINITIDWGLVPDEILTQYNEGALTLQDVYEYQLMTKQKAPSEEGA